MTVGGFGIGLWVCCGGMCVSLMMAAAFPRRKGGHEFYFLFFLLEGGHEFQWEERVLNGLNHSQILIRRFFYSLFFFPSKEIVHYCTLKASLVYHRA